MEIVPALEIKNGQSIWQTYPRATQPNLKITDPLKIVMRWKDEGATRIHLVDVDGVRVGMPQNRDVIRDLLRRIGLPVQLSGGVLAADVADRMYAIGVDRVVVPLNSVSEAQLAEMIRRNQEKVALEIKVLDGRWVSGDRLGAEVPIKAVVMNMKAHGVRRIILNVVDKLDAPIALPLEVASELAALPNLKVIVHHIITPQEIAAYAGVGIESVILGKALYENKISLSGA